MDVRQLPVALKLEAWFERMFLWFVSGNFPAISDDLVNSYHLLLCCCDWFYANALLSNRRDLLNPHFSGQSTSYVVCVFILFQEDMSLKCAISMATNDGTQTFSLIKTLWVILKQRETVYAICYPMLWNRQSIAFSGSFFLIHGIITYISSVLLKPCEKLLQDMSNIAAILIWMHRFAGELWGSWLQAASGGAVHHTATTRQTRGSASGGKGDQAALVGTLHQETLWQEGQSELLTTLVCVCVSRGGRLEFNSCYLGLAVFLYMLSC